MAQIEKRVTQDGRVRWTMRYYAGIDPDTGKRRFIIETFDRKKDATERAAELVSTSQGGPILRSKQPFGEYLRHWLQVKKGQLRAGTYDDYSGNVQRWITHPPAGAPRLGGIPLSRLSPTAFEQLYTWMHQHGRGVRTISYLHSVLHKALQDAVKKRALAMNPARNAERPTKNADDSEHHTEVRSMDRDQARTFREAACEDRYSALWHVLLTGGLRPSEALGLGWQHVDFDNGRVRIERTLTRRGVKGWRLVPCKTARSRRSVPLPGVAIRELRAWRAVQAKERLQLGSEYRDHGFVFTTAAPPFGEPMHLGDVSRRRFRALCAKCGFGEWRPQPKAGEKGPRGIYRFEPTFRLYDLRHTCATLLLEAGENLKVVSERLGHSTITMTADIYSHVLPDMQESAAKRLDALFGGADG